MFILELYDREGTKLNLGDIVKISDGSRFQFYAEVKYIEKENIITPFHTFTYRSFVKIDKLPNDVVKSTEERYNIWYHKNPEEDNYSAEFEQYLSTWRHIEDFMDKRCWRIKKTNPTLFEI